VKLLKDNKLTPTSSRIAQQAQGAQAARSGAFGGSGDYLMRASSAGNLARQKGDIWLKAMQSRLSTRHGSV
jgi:hypothetical protein